MKKREAPRSRPAEADQQISPEELRAAKAHLFAVLKTQALELPLEERNQLVYRVMDHSLEDGMDMVDALGLTRDEQVQGISRDAFIVKHPDLAFTLRNKLEGYRRFASPEDQEGLDTLTDTLAGKLATLESIETTGLRPPSVSTGAQPILKEIDNYYEHLLKQRRVGEMVVVDSRSPGERLGETQLHRLELELTPHYYRDAVRDIVANLAKGNKQEVLEKLEERLRGQQFVDEDTLREILHETSPNTPADDPWLSGKLRRAQYKPLLTGIGKGLAKENLLSEIETSLERRGYKPGEFKIKKDEKSGQYKVVIKEKGGAVENGQLDQEKLRTLATTPSSYWMTPEDPYYTQVGPQMSTFSGELSTDGVDPLTGNMKCYSSLVVVDGRIYRKIKSAGSSATFVVRPDGTRSPVFERMDHIKGYNGGLLFFSNKKTRRDDESFHEVLDDRGNVVISNYDFHPGGPVMAPDGHSYAIGNSPDSSRKVLFRDEEILEELQGEDVFMEGIVDGKLTLIVDSRKAGKGAFLRHGNLQYGPYDDIRRAKINDKLVFCAIEKDASGHANMVVHDADRDISFPIREELQGIFLSGGRLNIVVGTEEKQSAPARSWILDESGRVIAKAKGSIRSSSCMDINGQLAYVDEGKKVYDQASGKFVQRGKRVLHVGNERVEADEKIVLHGQFRGDALYSLGGSGDSEEIDRLKTAMGFPVEDVGKTLMTIHHGKINQDLDKASIIMGPDGESFSIIGIREGAQGEEDVVLRYEDNASLVVDEQRRLDLLNAVETPSLEAIHEYDKTYHTAEPVTAREKAEQLLNTSRAMISSLNNMIRSAPELFLETFASKKDPASDYYTEHLVRGLFPSVYPNLEKVRRAKRGYDSSGSFASRAGEDMRSAHLETHGNDRFLDGDPRDTNPKEVMRVRHAIPGFISTGCFDKYSRAGDDWERAVFPAATSLDGPTTEVTAEVDIGREVKISLPIYLNGSIIPERVKGIREDGEEVFIRPEVDPTGRATVKIPEGVVIVTYSQSVQEVAPTPEDVNTQEYERFKSKYERSFGVESSESIAVLPEEMMLFVESIRSLPPRARLSAIEQYVRGIGYYDFDNSEVQAEKRGRNVDDIMSIMRNRMRQVKKTNPEIASEIGGKEYAGICADFAKVTTALLREAGIISGLVGGFAVTGQDSSVTTRDAHALSFVPWPARDGKVQVITLDGTPRGLSDEQEQMLSGFQQGSLADRIRLSEEMRKKVEDSAMKRLTELETMVDNLDEDQIKKLRNGELEKALNVILARVKKSHVGIIDTVLNAARYAGIDASKLGKKEGGLESEIALRQLLEKEVARERTNEEGDEHFKGGKLLRVFENFTDRYSRDNGVEGWSEALDVIEKIVDVSKKYLDPVESRSAAAIITYLRASKMRA